MKDGSATEANARSAHAAKQRKERKRKVSLSDNKKSKSNVKQ